MDLLIGGKAMNETVNQENATVVEEPKTFTQEEVNGIVNDRLARERKKYEGINLEELKNKAQMFDEIEEKNKSELERANEKANRLQAELDNMKKTNEIKTMREKVASETGVPVNLLNGDTEEECSEQANAIKAFAIPNGYPNLKDGGEPQTMTKKTARDDFAAWANVMNQ